MKFAYRTQRRRFLELAAGAGAAGVTSSMFPQLSLIGDAIAQSSTTGYKALVCVFLDGGNDSWNMLIPSNPARHAEYVAARGGLYQGGTGAMGIPITGGGGPRLPNALALNGVEYALNPAMPELRTLFNQQRVSFLANVGQLVVPLRKSNFDDFVRPPQLFSHNDQTRLWHNGSGTSTLSAVGWGGALAARLLSAAPASGLSPCISINGQTQFLVGEYSGGIPVNPYALSGDDGRPATELENYDPGFAFGAGAKRREILQRASLEAYPQQLLTKGYADVLERSLRLAGTVNNAVAALNGNSAFNAFNAALNAMPNSRLGRQLRQVARMIAVSRFGQGTIQANRQIYFVSDGSYDTHGDQIPSAAPNAGVWDGHQKLLQDLSAALATFNAALLQLNAVAGYAGVANEVVTFTTSEFARTMNANSDGTDHAWGGTQLVMGMPTTSGGPLIGGQVIGRYPRIVLDRSFAGPAPDAFGESFERGEFLPSMAVEQMAGTLARWLGIGDSDLPALFPNIDNFGPAHPNAAVMAFNTRTVPILNFT